VRAKARDSVSSEYETAGGPRRNCEERIRLKRLSRMPAGRRAGDLVQMLGARVGRICGNRSKSRWTWGSCLAQRKDCFGGLTQTGVVVDLNYPSHSTENIEG